MLARPLSLWYPQSLLEPRIPADPCRSGPTKFPEERCSGSVDAPRSFLPCSGPSRLPVHIKYVPVFEEIVPAPIRQFETAYLP